MWPYFDDVEHKRAFEPSSIHRSLDSKLLAVGDTSGAVKLYNFPCIDKEVSGYFCLVDCYHVLLRSCVILMVRVG